MKLALIILFALPVALAEEKTPKRVCFAKQYQTDFYNTKTKMLGRLTVDFDRKLSAFAFKPSKIRLVYDFENSLKYLIFGQYCEYNKVDTKHAPDGHCLKEEARVIADGKIETSTGKSGIVIYENERATLGTWQLVTTDTDPAIVLFQTSESGTTHVFFNYNPKINADYFIIPDDCVLNNATFGGEKDE